MNKLRITLWAGLLVVGLAVAVLAQSYTSRPPSSWEQRKLAGATSWVQDELLRNTTPVIVGPGSGLGYQATNGWDGVVLVNTNDGLYLIGLPNATNYPNRKWEISSLGWNTFILANLVAGSFTDMFTMTNTTGTYPVASNKTAAVFSTGTNYIVRVH